MIVFCINEKNFVPIKKSNILKWCQTISVLVKRVCGRWLFNAKWEIFQMHHAVESYIPRYDDNGCLLLDQHASLDLSSQIVLTGYFVLLNTITYRNIVVLVLRSPFTCWVFGKLELCKSVDFLLTEEKFEDFKGVIRSRKWKKETHDKNVKKDKQWSTKHYTEN